MRSGAKRILSVMAAYAVALHAVLWVAAAPFAPASAVDPFTVICHSGAGAPADQAPEHGPPAPAHACDHCNLCNAASPPTAPDAVVTARFEPVLILRVLYPADFARHDDIATDPKLARGPPVIA